MSSRHAAHSISLFGTGILPGPALRSRLFRVDVHLFRNFDATDLYIGLGSLARLVVTVISRSR